MKKIVLILIALSISSFQQGMFTQSGWYHINLGTNDWLSDLFFLNENTGYIATQNGKILITTNSGLNWTQKTVNINGGEGFVHFFNSLVGIVADFSSGNIYKTTDGGNTFIQKNAPVTQYNEIFFPSYDTGYAMSKRAGIYKTTDNGENWFTLREAYISGQLQGDIYFINNLTGFFAGARPGFWNILRTTNGGTTFDSVYLNNTGSSCDVQFVNQYTGYFLGSTPARVYKTTNTGNSWYEVLSNIQNGNYMTSLYFVNESTGHVVGYSADASYKTTNGGLNWDVNVNLGLFNGLWDVEFVNATTGFAIKYEGGAIKTTDGGVIGIQTISMEIPEDFSLSQNYPNPFNPMTNVKFQISNKSFVKLIVFDILGRESATLVNEQLNAGTYVADFDGTNYPSGIYYYKLSADDYSETKKMILVK